MDPAHVLSGEPRATGAPRSGSPTAGPRRWGADSAPAAANWLQHPTTPPDQRGPLSKLLEELEAEIARGEVYTREEAAAILDAQLRSGELFAQDEAAARAAGELPDEEQEEEA